MRVWQAVENPGKNWRRQGHRGEGKPRRFCGEDKEPRSLGKTRFLSVAARSDNDGHCGITGQRCCCSPAATPAPGRDLAPPAGVRRAVEACHCCAPLLDRGQ